MIGSRITNVRYRFAGRMFPGVLMVTLALSATVCGGAKAQYKGINRVVNGSFENYFLTPGKLWETTSNIQGFKPKSPYTVEIQTAAVYPRVTIPVPQGRYFAEIDSPGTPLLTQDVIGLAVGKAYTLSFWYTPRPGQDAQVVAALINGRQIASAGGNGGTLAAPIAVPWRLVKQRFVAGATSVELAFMCTRCKAGAGNLIDDIQLTADAPECNDRVDNDGDGLIDKLDIDCTNTDDDDESSGQPPVAVSSADFVASSDNNLVACKYSGHCTNLGAIPYPVSPRPRGEDVVDLLFTGDGSVHVYNGTSAPYLSSLSNGSWKHAFGKGFSSTNVGDRTGGMASIGDGIYLADQRQRGDLTQGIVRASLTSGTSARFSNDAFIDLAAYPSAGLIFALSTNGRTVKLFDTSSFSEVGKIQLTRPVRSIAVTATGQLYGGGADGKVYRFGSGGESPVHLLPPRRIGGIVDLNAANGKLVAGGSTGMVLVVNDDLSAGSAVTVRVGKTAAFAAARN